MRTVPLHFLCRSSIVPGFSSRSDPSREVGKSFLARLGGNSGLSDDGGGGGGAEAAWTFPILLVYPRMRLGYMSFSAEKNSSNPETQTGTFFKTICRFQRTTTIT